MWFQEMGHLHVLQSRDSRPDSTNMAHRIPSHIRRSLQLVRYPLAQKSRSQDFLSCQFNSYNMFFLPVLLTLLVQTR
jgi:hypothetical protein